MNEWLEPLRTFLRQRSPRERWLMVLVGCVLSLLLVHGLFVGPLQARAEQAKLEIETLEGQMVRAIRMASDVRRLQAELVPVEELIVPGGETDLGTLVESLARKVKLTDKQLESIKSRPTSKEERYPETRVEVKLKGVTLKQTVQLLHRIERDRLHLVVRSLRITTKGKKKPVLDVSFSVSSFERA